MVYDNNATIKNKKCFVIIVCLCLQYLITFKLCVNHSLFYKLWYLFKLVSNKKYSIVCSTFPKKNYTDYVFPILDNGSAVRFFYNFVYFYTDLSI